MKKLLFILTCLMANTVTYSADSTNNTNSANSTDWTTSNLAVVDEFAIPAYQQLKKSSNDLVKSSDAFCNNVNKASFAEIKKQFHQTMDSWQSIQILRTGPADNFMRAFRLEMWPDRSNAAAKHLRKLQQDAKPESLEAKKFSRASTAVQGLSALERLLYAKDINKTAFQTDGKANFKCQLVQAISLNVQTISTDLLKAWQTNYRDMIAKPSKDNDAFETDKEVAAQFLNNLHTQLQAIIDQKINRPIDGDKFRLTRAESWRSQRSLRNIALNLAASKQLYQTGFIAHIADKKLRKKQLALFETAIELSKDKALNLPLKEAYEQHTAKLQQWITSIKALKTSIATELPTSIGIHLGFNSLDGD